MSEYVVKGEPCYVPGAVVGGEPGACESIYPQYRCDGCRGNAERLVVSTAIEVERKVIGIHYVDWDDAELLVAALPADEEVYECDVVAWVQVEP